MDKNALNRILQKAEEYEKRRQATTVLQDQTEEVLLKRIRQKAEEQEKMKQRDLEWNDKLAAIRETYGLSEEEIQTIVEEVRQEKTSFTPPPSSKVVPKTPIEKITSLFFSPKGKIGRKTFALSMLATAILEGFAFSLSARGFLPAGLVGIVGFFAQAMIAVKRFHDLGKSGWFSLLLFLPLLNVFVFLYLLLFPGKEAPTPYDEDQELI